MEVVDVDRDIILMGATDNPDFPGVQSNPQSTNDTYDATTSQPPSKSSNPFGGGTPEYER